MLTAELSEDEPGLRLSDCLGRGSKRSRNDKRRTIGPLPTGLRELEYIAREAAAVKQEPTRLRLTKPGEYGLFTILRAHASSSDETYIPDCSRRMVDHLRHHGLLVTGWSNSVSGRKRVEQSLLAESWNAHYDRLGFDPNAQAPQCLEPAVEELAESDGMSDR